MRLSVGGINGCVEVSYVIRLSRPEVPVDVDINVDPFLLFEKKREIF
jgi:hypothetical protein